MDNAEMWVMVVKKLQTVVSPPKMSLHWATPYYEHSGYVQLKQYIRKTLKMAMGSHYEHMYFVHDPEKKLAALMDKPIENWTDKEGPFDNSDWGVFLRYTGESGDELYYGDWQELRNMVSINVLGEKIVLYNREYSVVSSERMADYIDEACGSHILVQEDVIGDTVVPTEIKFSDKEQRQYYEAALLDGASIIQAYNVSLGRDPDISDIPVMGWYNVRPEYASMFCREGEEKLDDFRGK
jgi:hypothetical protein